VTPQSDLHLPYEDNSLCAAGDRPTCDFRMAWRHKSQLGKGTGR
jgi:hypothetical protein